MTDGDVVLNAVIYQVRGHCMRGDGCVIAVLRGEKSMKKVILKTKTMIKPDILKMMAEDFKRQWDDGFIIVPNNFAVQLVDEDWTDVEKMIPPEGKMVLIWMEYEDGENVCQTYGFGKYEGDGWTVYLQQATRILAWMLLPEPFQS